jgi:Putative zinc-finger
MPAEACRPWREQIGALVLGGLDESEAAGVRAHLEGCAECRAEAEALRPLGALLRRVEPEHLDPGPQPPSGLGRRVLARIREERRAQRQRRLRVAFAGAAAAVALGAGALVVGAWLGSSDSPESDEAEPIRFEAARGELNMTGVLIAQDWGSEIHIYADGVRPGTECHVYLRREGGAPVPVGSFRYQREWSDSSPALSTALTADEIRAVVVDAGDRSGVAPLGRGSSGS